MQVLYHKLLAVRSVNEDRHVLPGHSNVGIVIEGGALQHALEPACQDALMALCRECKAVVCCRVTPMQKAQVRAWQHRVAACWLQRAGHVLGVGSGHLSKARVAAAKQSVGAGAPNKMIQAHPGVVEYLPRMLPQLTLEM